VYVVCCAGAGGEQASKWCSMSATISKSTFVDYFQGAGARVAQVELQGFSHPVEDLTWRTRSRSRACGTRAQGEACAGPGAPAAGTHKGPQAAGSTLHGKQEARQGEGETRAEEGKRGKKGRLRMGTGRKGWAWRVAGKAPREEQQGAGRGQRGQ